MTDEDQTLIKRIQALNLTELLALIVVVGLHLGGFCG